MVSTFGDGVDQFLATLPSRITGRVEVNQVYAHYQEVHPEFHHPDGGQAFYLRDSLFIYMADYYRRLAERAIDRDGSHLRDAMIENVESISTEVYKRAPWEFGDLRASGHPSVEEDGSVVYDRPALCRRLSEEELAIKGHLRYLLDSRRYRR